MDTGAKPSWVDVPPKPNRLEILWELHQTMGHLGREKLLDSVRDWYWWPGLAADAALVTRTCEACCKDRSSGKIQVPSGQIYKGD